MKSKNAKTDCEYILNAWGTLVLVKFKDRQGTVWQSEVDEYNERIWFRECEGRG